MQIINQLAQHLNLNTLDAALYLQNAPSKYKVYKIRKRTTGFRIIAQPTKSLKSSKERLSHYVLFQYMNQRLLTEKVKIFGKMQVPMQKMPIY